MFSDALWWIPLGLILLAALPAGLVLGIVAQVRINRLHRRLGAHDDERLQRVESLVAVLDRRVTALARELRARAPEVGAASADAPAPVLPAQALAPSGPDAVDVDAGSSARREAVVAAEQALLVAAKAMPAVAAVASAPLASAAAAAATGADRADAAAATAAGAALGAGVPTPEAQPSLEERIGLVWFNRIGAAVLLLGVAYFFKYAVDNAWIGPVGRVAIGAFVGSALLVLAEWLRPRTRLVFIHALVGVGLAILLFSAYAAFGFYQLLPLPIAFAVLALVVLLGGALALHHQSEAVLVIALVAGLATPVLLSTGQDRPFALFSYLLVLTALSQLVAVPRAFRWATWIAIAGATVLFVGWYRRFFDLHAPPLFLSLELPPALQQAPYYPLAARLVPLGALAAFLLQWLLAWWVARQRQLDRLSPLALLLFSAVTAHAGASALLYDRPELLGGGFVALAALFGWLLRREGRLDLLIVPLLASFFALLATSERAQERPLALLLVLGGWAALYAATFLRGRFHRDQPLSPRALFGLGAIGAALLVLLLVLLGGQHPLLLLWLVALLAALYVALSLHARAPLIGALSALATATVASLLAQRPVAPGSQALFLLAASLWAMTYVAGAAWDWLRRRQPAATLQVATVAFAALAYVVMVLVYSAASQRLLRAALVGATGLANLGLGATLLRREPGARRQASVLLGLALALFAAAAALLLSGASITLVWAALGAVVVALAVQEDDAAWLIGGLVLLALTLGRALMLDLLWAEQEAALFFGSNGQAGRLAFPALFNPRTLGLCGAACAALVSARFCARRPERTRFRRSAWVLFGAGHFVLMLALIQEVGQLALSLPAEPAVALAEDEFGAFRSAYFSAVRLQEGRRAMVTTLALGLYAAALVGLGFGRRHAPSRLLGLGFFSLTLVKLALHDVWRLERPYQIAVLVGVGALLLTASFLYARHGRRLLALLKDGGRTLVLLLALSGGLGLVPTAAWATPTQRLPQRCALQGVTGPGLFRLEIVPLLYQQSASTHCPLCDLRVTDGAGRELPLAVRAVGMAEAASQRPVTMVDPLILPDGATRATFDLGQQGLRHSELELQLDRTNFLRRVQLEVSADGQRWALLDDANLVYHVRSGSHERLHARLAYAPSDQRYIRATLEARPGSEPVPIRGGIVRLVPPAARLPVRTVERPVERLPPAPELPRRSRVLVDAGHAGVPFSAAELVVGPGAFERRVTVRASNERSFWPTVGTGVVAVAEGGPGHPLDQLELEFEPTAKRYFVIEVEDGDSPPIALRRVRLSYRPDELVFRAAAGGDHWLYLGAPELGAGQYDLGAVLARSRDAELRPARCGALQPNPGFGAGPAVPQPWSERYALPLGLVLGALLLGLALWTLLLLRRSPKLPPPGSTPQS
ncbi:MAG: DUF2339 domain-containing protein [Proteobacteria bacterium]|nr:DUF2339 domain-containing protein [Pseudomonadota bacterium]